MLPQHYAGKVQGLKELYAFRMLMKAKIAAYKRAIGKEPDHAQRKQILYVCMAVNARNLASESGLDKESYTKITEDIDRRYRLQYGGLDSAKPDKADDPMGLSALNKSLWIAELSGSNRPGEAATHPAEDGRRPEAGAAASAPLKDDLDAVGKGKGKGKGDGKCHT